VASSQEQTKGSFSLRKAGEVVTLSGNPRNEKGCLMKYSEHEEYLLREWVLDQEATKLGRKTTVVCLTLENGYEVLGTSACVDPETYDYEGGIFYATKDALLKVDEIVSYLAHNARVFF
jgi:hypothetical protein